MTGAVTDRNRMLEIQGDRVLLHKLGVPARVLTIVHAVNETGHELRLVNREDKSGKPDWPISQKLFEAIHPAKDNKAKAVWEVTVK